jgi:hypothetical protein
LPYFHIINANKGFVILSCDSLYPPLLAYDSISNFSFSNEDLNPGLVLWLNKHAHELDFIRSNKDSFLDSIENENKILWQILGVSDKKALNLNNTTASGASPLFVGNCGLPGDPPTLISTAPAYLNTNSTIGPLCPTLWGQENPFNLDCPLNAASIYAGHYIAGCTPIAMAQVMYFWKYPTTPPPGAPNNIAYNFAGMPLNKQAADLLPVGDMQRLIYDCGIALQTSYGPSESKTAPDNIDFAFSLMHYSSASQTSSLSQQALSGPNDGITFADLLTNEIQTNKRPCIVSGYTIYHNVGCCGILPSPGGDGHTWVCDGSNVSVYKTGTTTTYRKYDCTTYTQTLYTSTVTTSLLHMNWGLGKP